MPGETVTTRQIVSATTRAVLIARGVPAERFAVVDESHYEFTVTLPAAEHERIRAAILKRMRKREARLNAEKARREKQGKK